MLIKVFWYLHRKLHFEIQKSSAKPSSFFSLILTHLLWKMQRWTCSNIVKTGWLEYCERSNKYLYPADIWDKILKNGPSKICGRQPLKNLKRYGLPKAVHIPSNFERLSSTNVTWSILEYFVPYTCSKSIIETPEQCAKSLQS